MERMRPPAFPEQPVDVLTDDELRALLTTCRGNTFENRRYTAILRMLIDTGMRAGELAGLSVEDLDPEQAVAFVLGKGRRDRAAPYGAEAADALRRYLRARDLHP
ncbi:tyrosine-type recombinase/integrase [Geodermatophilus sabuli]|uniref:tyrosine-type recombinase/integrase n=1 Tax=Geodermatophilus sabuli TaxID=1564158 RepID=UPI00195320C6|nr:tyrosine-type recombinase/integrase [Geodermatophilus sabuli]